MSVRVPSVKLSDAPSGGASKARRTRRTPGNRAHKAPGRAVDEGLFGSQMPLQGPGAKRRTRGRLTMSERVGQPRPASTTNAARVKRRRSSDWVVEAVHVLGAKDKKSPREDPGIFSTSNTSAKTRSTSRGRPDESRPRPQVVSTGTPGTGRGGNATGKRRGRPTGNRGTSFVHDEQVQASVAVSDSRSRISNSGNSRSTSTSSSSTLLPPPHRIDPRRWWRRGTPTSFLATTAAALLSTFTHSTTPFFVVHCQDMSHSFDMSHHVEDNIMSVHPEDLDDETTYEIPVLHQLECSDSDVWKGFKKQLQKMDDGAIKTATELIQASFSDEMELYTGVDGFFHDICDLTKQQTPICVYGIINALVVLGLAGDLQYAKNPGMGLLGSLQCLDYMESSTWRFKSGDLVSLMQNSTAWELGQRAMTNPFVGGFARQRTVSSDLGVLPDLSGKDVSAWSWQLSLPGTHGAETTTVPASAATTAGTGEGAPLHSIRVLLFGTHPTLTLEPYTMMADHVFPASQGYDLDLQGVFGIAYKCHLYPMLCNDDDPIAALLGAFDKADENYTTEKTIATLELLFQSSLSKAADLFVCTSPFFLCAVIAALIPAGALNFNYMGLPALWKAPHDFADHEETFWKYGHAFFQRANSVHVTNNPLLFEQLRYAFGKDDTSRMRILRPHNRYMNAYYVPRKHLQNRTPGAGRLLHYVGVVSRTKFQWVTFECLFKRMIHFGKLPFKFDVLNTDSKKSFFEMASYTAIVLLPWEAALMAFYEYYSMNMPMFLPAREMLYRTVYHAEGNLGTTKPIYMKKSPLVAAEPSAEAAGDEKKSDEHPFPPFAFDKLDSRAYWLGYSDFARWPGLKYFYNLQELCKYLLQEDAPAMAATMKLHNDKTFASSVAFYRDSLSRLF